MTKNFVFLITIKTNIMKTEVTDLKLPKNNLSEVLFILISKGTVSLYDVKMSGFRRRITDLKKQINIVTTYNTKVNKYGNTIRYGIHKLKNKNQGIKLYKKLTN